MQVRPLAVVVLSLFLTVPGLAAAQSLGVSAPYAGQNDWREEPNVLAPGTIPYDWYGSPSADHPADANNLELAKAGAVRVLQVKWAPYQWPLTVVGGTYTGTGTSGLFNQDINNLFSPYTGKNFIWPATQSSWHAFLGVWHDLDGDGFRDAQGHWRNSVDGHDRAIYVNAGSDNECERQDLRTDDPDGAGHFGMGNEGNLLPVPILPVNTGVSYRCTNPNEWVGEGGNSIVGYVAPGTWSASRAVTISVPCPLPLGQQTIGQDPECRPSSTRQAPQLVFQANDFYGQGTYTRATVYTVTQEGSMLETKAVTSFSDARVVTDGRRTHEPTAGVSLFDVDIYQSLDPTLESVYQTTLHRDVRGLWQADAPGRNATWNEVYDEVKAGLAFVDETVPDDVQAGCHSDPLRAAHCVVHPVYGPATAPVMPPWDRPQPHVDYTEGPHLYLAMRMVESTGFSALLQASNGILVTTVAGYGLSGGSYSIDRSGEAGNPGSGNGGTFFRIALDGRFGVWHDKNQDGFIGAPLKTETCPDPYNCGANRDPNSYAQGTSFGEFTPLCLPEPRASGVMYVELWPDTHQDPLEATWGEVGAYLYYDEGSDEHSTQNGRASFNPYDDIVFDAANGFQRLYTKGPVPMRAVCTGNSGLYRSFEHLWVPLGHKDFGIHLATEVVTMTLASLGIDEPQSVQDQVHRGRWQL